MIKRIVTIAVFLSLFLTVLLYADTPMQGYSAILDENVIDLRAGSQLRSKAGNQPGRVFTPGDLEVGSIFLTVDNEARKVTDIYEHNGKTVIETIEPRPEEVFLSLYIPDFEVTCDRSNIDISSLADGVTLLPPGADKKDMLSSNFTPPAEMDKSVTWLETDPETEDANITSFNIDIPLWTKDVSGDVLKLLEKQKDDAKEKEKEDQSADSSSTGDSEDGTTFEAGGKPSLDMGAAGEIRLVGTLRMAEPTVSGGVKMPYLKLTWVSKWWGGYPKIEHHSGYAKAGFTAAQQFDFRLTGTLKLTAELKVPLFAVVATYYGVTGTIGFYAKVGLEGQISLCAEVSEFTRHEVSAKAKLVWPFIPVKFSADADNYLNFAFRPIISAEAELKAGLYLGVELEAAGITIVGAEGGGGGYISAQGYMEPMGIMGFETDSMQMYGNFNEWILDLSAEAGAYVEVGAEILTVEIPIYDKKWPFWEWHQSWEF